MKKYIFYPLLISFFFIAVFGFAMTDSGHAKCIANLAVGAFCGGEGPFGLVNFHLNAFYSFISVIGQQLSILLLLAAIYLLAFRLFSTKLAYQPITPDRVFNTATLLPQPNSALSRLLIWLSLTEKRDPLC